MKHTKAPGSTRRRSSAPVVLAASLILLGSPALASEPPLSPPLRAVPFNRVEIRDAFWAPRRETNRLVSIPVNLENLRKAGNLENLERAGAGEKGKYRGPVFMDSDAYKAIEAASYSLAQHPDPALEQQLDAIIATLAKAQQPNGYLNSYFTVQEPDKRWTNLRDCHELYCAGHLFEAAVAHYEATGKRSFLDVATRLADHIDSVFGGAPGKRMGYPGHPEIELALIKLYRATGEPRYLQLAQFFVESRGQHFFAREHGTPDAEYDGSYWQDDVPICDHRNIKGHAVRACYLLSGATDVAAETGNPALLRMIGRVWRNTTERNLYVTGGIGPSAHNEGFTVDYDLPNLTAYQETCATIALAQWNHRLALLYGDARYADVLERALYNGVLAGVSQDGRRFFYVNPLASTGHHHRSEWFDCACCPPNVARTLAALGGYAYATRSNALYVNLYIQGKAQATVGGTEVTLEVTTDYPWDGRVSLKPALKSPATFDLRLRVPDWCTGAETRVNGERVMAAVTERGYLVLARTWKTGDTVQLDLPMPVLRMAANPNVKADQGRVALQRGPLVYCLEACDQTAPLETLFLPLTAQLEAAKDPALLGGVVVIRGRAATTTLPDWDRALYQPVAEPQPVPIVAVPYYAWDNRAPGGMEVWLPVSPPAAPQGGLATRAKITVSFANNNSEPAGINDGLEAAKSGEQPAALCHWWPHKGTEEWAQLAWSRPVALKGSRVFWFDDTGRGECRLPDSWQLQYREGDAWKPVVPKTSYAVAADQWCEVEFEPVTTTALRLQVKMKSGWAAGVHEWQVTESDD